MVRSARTPRDMGSEGTRWVRGSLGGEGSAAGSLGGGGGVVVVVGVAERTEGIELGRVDDDEGDAFPSE